MAKVENQNQVPKRKTNGKRAKKKPKAKIRAGGWVRFSERPRVSRGREENEKMTRKFTISQKGKVSIKIAPENCTKEGKMSKK